MKSTSHLQAGGVSLLFLIAALTGFSYFAGTLERRYVSALAPSDLNQTFNGIALQRAAFHQPDLLPVYGSSEITMIDTPYDAEKFFASYPTGFAVFDVANLGAASLTMAQDLAALGPDLRGKKIVISFSPATFTMSRLPPDYYAGNFSPLHAYELIFSPYLRMPLKIEAANRMLEFPNTLQHETFLQFAMDQMTGTSRADRLMYYLSWPLGELQIAAMRVQDHAEVVAYLWSHPGDETVRKIPKTIDWPATFASALDEQKKHTLSNSLGVEDEDWWWYQHVVTNPIPAGSEDKGFIYRVEQHPEWVDLNILLRVLQESGAKPLILSRPMNVHLWEALGVSEQAQDTYYVKLNETVNQYPMPLVDYQQYGTDIYFSIDQGAHTSRYGWVYVDRTLDEFFHGRLQP